MFIFIARYFKEMRHKFGKKGKTQEEYEAYLTTNHNSFRFARYVVVMIIVVALINSIIINFSNETKDVVMTDEASAKPSRTGTVPVIKQLI